MEGRTPAVRTWHSGESRSFENGEGYMSIEIRNVTKRWGDFVALNDVNLSLPEGELVALLGPSGSGKTTLLRIIAGLETPDTGEILFGGENTHRKALHERGVGFVFQHYALFRHMNVFDNIAFGLRVKKKRIRPSEEVIREKVNELLRLVQLEGYAKHMPTQLSGGQRQRVALARALAVEPKYLLLDEPFGALDARVRRELRRWLRRLHDELHVTSLFVTHDQQEALEVSDRIIVMNRGRIEQEGTPAEVYEKPRSAFVLDFLGNVNRFSVQRKSSESQADASANGQPASDSADTITLFVRPHEIELTRERRADSFARARIEHIHFMGSQIGLELHNCDTQERFEVEMTIESFRELRIVPGDVLFARMKHHRTFEECGVEVFQGMSI